MAVRKLNRVKCLALPKASRDVKMVVGRGAVGKGKPPKERQFQKGQSGNPRGRPKGSKNLATLIAEAAYDKIIVTTKNGETRKLSRIQATTMQLANKAAQGEPKAMLSFMNWVDEIEQRSAAAKSVEMPITEADRSVLKEIYIRMQLCTAP
jgi:hypothetical protein